MRSNSFAFGFLDSTGCSEMFGVVRLWLGEARSLARRIGIGIR